MRMRLLAASVISLALGAGGGRAAVILEMEPNDTLATAQDLNGNFTADFRDDVGDKTMNTSTDIPHVTVEGTGDNTFDFYSFAVLQAGSLGIFDVDNAYDGTPNSDMAMHLFRADGTWIASNHTGDPAWGQMGSATAFDPYLEYTFTQTGTYILALAQEFSTPLPDGRVGGSGVKPDVSYTLHVSVPEPGALALAGCGLIGLLAWSRRRAR